jgi:hypothetical protein
MGSSDKAGVVETLRSEHEQIRARLQQAMNASPPVSAAAKRLVQLCFPHFESEEKIVFPVLERVHRLPSTSLAGIHEHIAQLSRERKRVGRDHESIICAAHALSGAAQRQGDSDLVDLANLIARHERTEDDLGMVVYDLGIARKSHP